MIDLEVLNQSRRAPVSEGVLDVIAGRWSPRAFSAQPVSTADLTAVFEAAAWAPSSLNEQPWRFLIGRQGDATYAKIFDALVGANQSWAKAAPVLILSVARAAFSNGYGANGYALHDTGAATAYLALQASALGLHAHSMGGFDRQKARDAFSIPDAFEIGAVTALGYLGDPDMLSEALRARETAPRTRRPLAETVFTEWEIAATL
ncbi:Nitroreductase [Granulicella rosea]|uniref:Nitroreductase n=1 Tax=Granulicella rosea TaxID=474952 RepID=A0A239M9C5_9BACT|nr:nitroreductase family protein [Granulicella rosea]SNT38594.1 Nitroreductase [Granulicella rosea]